MFLVVPGMGWGWDRKDLLAGDRERRAIGRLSATEDVSIWYGEGSREGLDKVSERSLKGLDKGQSR